jgi:hypothetical protein
LQGVEVFLPYEKQSVGAMGPGDFDADFIATQTVKMPVILVQ